MTILTNSRYVNQPVVGLIGTDGQAHPTVLRSSPPQARSFLHYDVKQGDRLDLLANRFFQDSTLWWLIADANPEIFYPDMLSPGSIIRIPQG